MKSLYIEEQTIDNISQEEFISIFLITIKVRKTFGI